MFNLSLIQLEDIISKAVDYGIELNRQSQDPLSGRLSKAEARKYILRMGYSVATMKQWESDGLLVGEKSGEKHNSPVYYQTADIKKLVCAISMKKAFLENQNN